MRSRCIDCDDILILEPEECIAGCFAYRCDECAKSMLFNKQGSIEDEKLDLLDIGVCGISDNSDGDSLCGF